MKELVVYYPKHVTTVAQKKAYLIKLAENCLPSSKNMKARIGEVYHQL